MGLPYYILPMPKIPTTTFVVKRGSNCYKTRGFPRYGKWLRVLSEEVQNLRHISAWRNDRTSHVYYRVESLCVDITPTAKIRFLDFFDHSLWSFVLPRGIQKCRLYRQILHYRFIIDKSSTIVLFIAFDTVCSERKIAIIMPNDFCQPQMICFFPSVDICFVNTK